MLNYDTLSTKELIFERKAIRGKIKEFKVAESPQWKKVGYEMSASDAFDEIEGCRICLDEINEVLTKRKHDNGNTTPPDINGEHEV